MNGMDQTCLVLVQAELIGSNIFGLVRHIAGEYHRGHSSSQLVCGLLGITSVELVPQMRKVVDLDERLQAFVRPAVTIFEPAKIAVPNAGRQSRDN